MAENDWRAALPETLRASPALMDVKDVAGLAQAFVDTKAMVGGSIRAPGPDASPEAKKEFRDKLQKMAPELIALPEKDEEREAALLEHLGVPKDEKAYTLEGVELDQGVKLSEDQLRATAKALRLTPKQYKALAKAASSEQYQALAAVNQADAALRKEWGQAYDELVGKARAAAVKLGVPEDAAKAMPPQQLRVFANVAKAVGGEGRQVANQDGGGEGKLTPAEAKLRAAEIRSRPEYWDRQKNPALHDQLIAKHLELMKIAG